MALGAFSLWILVMKVYRVEHRTTTGGPYGGYKPLNVSRFKGARDAYYWWEDEIHPPHSEDKGHPSPWCDGVLNDIVGWKCRKIQDKINFLNETDIHKKIYSWKCCFSSLSKLNEWFTKNELKTLCKNNFKIAKYEVPEEYVFNGEKQSIAIIGV